MKISLNEIKKYIDVPKDVSTKELIKLIGSRLVEIEGTIELKPKYEGILVVQVVKCEKIPDTHLTLCQIDDGSDELTQVVCGAPNVHKGMLAAWIKPGAIVPATYGNEDFRLSVRKLRGYESNGMLAAADELDLGDDHDGIIEIEPGFAKPGDVFAEVFGLNDTILDIENKSLTHRPDCFGIIGFAREVYGILSCVSSVSSPGSSRPSSRGSDPIARQRAPQCDSTDKAHDNISRASSFVFGDCAGYGRALARETRNDGLERRDPKMNGETIEINIKDEEICEKYCCAVVEVKDATSKNKYFTLDDVFLAKAGMRSISKIVDVTNILMLLTGQPLHAFDYDKFLKVGGGKKAKVGVRLAKMDEELQLLDGKTIKCDPNDILITSNDIPVALAGAMGGASTEIDASTKRVLLESATFSLYHLRKTQMKHGIFSEAITRFTKGQPMGNTVPVLLSACTVLSRDASLEPVVTGLAHSCSVVTSASPSKEGALRKEEPVRYFVEPKEVSAPSRPIKVSVEQINGLLGTEYSVKKCVETLTNVGFEVLTRSTAKNGGMILEVTVPYWRTDIHIPEDIIEEIGRLNGFDNIPKTLASRPFVGAKIDKMFALKTQLRGVLADNLKAHEVLTYSFVSKDLQKKVLEDSEKSYEIVNSLSPELQVFRQSLIPSLLDKVYDNLKVGYKDFALFEMNQVTNVDIGKDEDGVPEMENHLAVVVVGNYYEAKMRLMAIFEELGFSGDVAEGGDILPYFEKGRSAEVVVKRKGKTVKIGSIGEIKSRVRRSLKLEPVVAGFEISLDELVKMGEVEKRDYRISKYPAVERDVTVNVATKVPYSEMKSAIEAALSEDENLIYKVEDMSIYQKDEERRNLSFRLKFANMRETMSAKEITKVMERVTREVKKMKGDII